MTTTTEAVRTFARTITDEQIRNVRVDAGCHGDGALATECTLALTDDDARLTLVRALASAAAADDNLRIEKRTHGLALRDVGDGHSMWWPHSPTQDRTVLLTAYQLGAGAWHA